MKKHTNMSHNYFDRSFNFFHCGGHTNLTQLQVFFPSNNFPAPFGLTRIINQNFPSSYHHICSQETNRLLPTAKSHVSLDNLTTFSSVATSKFTSRSFSQSFNLPVSSHHPQRTRVISIAHFLKNRIFRGHSLTR